VEDIRKKFIKKNFDKAVAKPALTDWEKNFLNYISSKIERNADLSEKEYNKLFEIAEKR
jgi:hypothetical protein